MSQVTAGTVSVVQGSTSVVGTGVDWSTVPVAAIFYVQGDARSYDLAGITATQLTLQVPYEGITDAAASYALSVDFTPNLSLPRIGQGDIDTRGQLRRIVDILDSVWGSGGGGGGPPGVVQSVFGRAGNVVAQVGDYTLALISETATYVRMLATERTKLQGIADGAQANRLIATQAEAEAGTVNGVDMTPLRTAQAITARAGGSRHVIYDEGIPATSLTGLNFVGVGVTVTSDVPNDRNVITIPGAGAGFDQTTLFGASRPNETNRALTTRISELINVKDFGAIGNGTTNDFAAINAAIDYCNTSQDYPTLYFPQSGGYRTYNYSLTSLNPGINVRMDSPIIFNLGGAPIPNGPLWRIGSPTSQNPGTSGCVHLDLWIETIGVCDYPSNPNLIGVQIANLNNSTVRLRRIGAFTYGAELAALGGNYCSGNTFYITRMDGQYALSVVAYGTNSWCNSNTFYCGNFGHEATASVDRAAIFMQSFGGALGMHANVFYDCDIELATDFTHRADAFRTVGVVNFTAYNLYLESNGAFLFSDGGGYGIATYKRAGVNDVVVDEPAFSGSCCISNEQMMGIGYVTATGNRTLSQNDVNTQHRNSGAACNWTIKPFIGSIFVDNVDGGGAITLTPSGVTMLDTSIAPGKFATLIGRAGGNRVLVVEQP